MAIFGKDYTPPDLHAKITGRAKYAEDFRADGMLFAKVLASPMPHARVRNIDASEALAMEGVEAILTADDLPDLGPLSERALTMEPLYEGEPILAVAATSELLAAEAIEKIKIDYEPLPFALDPLESLKPSGSNARVDGNTIVNERTEEGRRTVVKELRWSQDVFDEAGDHLPMGEHQDEWSYGDLEAGFAEADYVIEETLAHQSVTHHPMEPRTCMATVQNGKVILHASTQSVARTHGPAAAWSGIDGKDLVVIGEYCGGGFGSKIVGTVNMPIAALLAKKTNRPVMHRITRYEETYIGRARPGFQTWIKVGFRKDGSITALDMYIIQDNGPYGRQGDLSMGPTTASLAYQPQAMRFRGVSVLTNTPPRSAQRAPGGAQIIAMIEPMMDRAAAELGLDRLEIRRTNAPQGKAKVGPQRAEISSAFVHEMIDQAKEKLNWDELKTRSGQRNGSKVTGIGLGFSPFIGGVSGFDGLLVIKDDGKVHVHTGVGNLGTHSFSDTARVAADVLGLEWEDINVIWGNTGKHLPWTTVQAGSMTTHATTRAIHAAASDAKAKLQELAAAELGGSASSYDVSGGRVHPRGNRRGGMSLASAAQKAVARGGKFSGEELPENIHRMTTASATALAGQGLLGVAKDEYDNGGPLWSFVLGCAEIEIDVETGVLEMTNYTAITDCGTVMNPRSLAAQLHGGGIQGFGLARYQKWIYDPSWGIPFAHRFYTARPPTILDVPREMAWGAVGEPDPYTPVGAKGIGEPPIGAGQAALVSAIQDALGGKVIRKMPVMVENILNALEDRPQDTETLTAHS